MNEKPATAEGYSSESLEHVRSTCLFLATILGDLLDDIIIVGGLVPSLLISKEDLSENTDPHVGTNDLDLGLALALLDEERYREISSRLRDRGFRPDINKKGNETFQRWKYARDEITVTLDFLIPPSEPDTKGGKLKHLEDDFAAVITPGLELAFTHYVAKELKGQTLLHENAARTINVCDIGPFIVLKALAFKGRGENKDAYDLYYVIQNYPGGAIAIANKIRLIQDDQHSQNALQTLSDDFCEIDALGPRRVADFLYSQPDDTTQAQVSAAVNDLLNELK